MEPLVSPSTYGVRTDTAHVFASPEEKLLISFALVAILLAARWALVRLIRNQSDYLSDGQLRWIAWIRNGGVIAILVTLFALWLPELEAFALSVAAVAVAIVIATKELIMCIAGGLVRSASGSFNAGDWVEVGGHSGEVAEYTLVSTTLTEFDIDRMEYTGRTVTLPNSVFLGGAVVNNEFRKRYIFHEFAIHSEPAPGAREAQEAIRAALEARTKGMAEVGSRYAALIERRMGVHMPPVAPRVRLRTTEIAKLCFAVTVFCPRDQALELEAVAMEAWQDWLARQDWRFAIVSSRPEPGAEVDAAAHAAPEAAAR